MPNYHMRINKIKTGEDHPFAFIVFNFDTIAEMKDFENRIIAAHTQMMSEQNNGVKAVSITGEVRA